MNPYTEAGVDTAAGDLAVELMKSAVRRTHGPEVLGGVGGFAGLFDASALRTYARPLLATSTTRSGSTWWAWSSTTSSSWEPSRCS